MKLALASLAMLLMLASACSPPVQGCCGNRTSIARDVVYTASMISPDGGTTEVRVNVATNGKTTLTFINGGREIVEGFDGVALTP